MSTVISCIAHSIDCSVRSDACYRIQLRRRFETRQTKDRNFGATIESDLFGVAESTIHEECASIGQLDKALHVSLVANGSQRCGQKRWLALTTVRVAGEDDSAELTPNGSSQTSGLWQRQTAARSSRACDKTRFASKFGVQ